MLGRSKTPNPSTQVKRFYWFENHGEKKHVMTGEFLFNQHCFSADSLV